MISEPKFKASVDSIRDLMARYTRPSIEASPEEIAARRKLYETDFLGFSAYYFAHYCTREFAEFHHELAGILLSGASLAAAAPRGTGKSTFALMYAAYCLAFGLRKFIIIESQTEDLSKEFTQYLGMELSENPRLRQDFGELLRTPFEDTDWITETGARVLARGYRQPLRGRRYRQHRPDLIIFDDMENEELVRSADRVREMCRWMRSAAFPAMSVERKGQAVWIGTILAQRSVLAQLLDEDFADLFTQRRYMMLTEGQSLWPAMFPIEELEIIRQKIGTIAFNAEYQNEVLDETSPFRSEWIRYYNRADLADVPMSKILFVDPSAKAHDLADYKALVLVGTLVRPGPKPAYYVLRAWIRHASMLAMIEEIFKWDLYEDPAQIGFEINGFQEYVADSMLPIMAERRHALPLRKVTQTANKQARIAAMSPMFENGFVNFVKDDPDQARLIEQLLFFPSRTVKDDGPDALEGCLSLMKNRAGGEVRTTGIKREMYRAGAYV